MRTPEDKYRDAAARGRTVAQIRSVAVARGDTEMIKYLEQREAAPPSVWDA